MILHYVFFKFKDGFSWADPKAISAESTTKKHDKCIEEIKGWFCGRNISNRQETSDFIVIGLFDNQESINSYLQHSHHHIGVNKWKEIANWNVIDIDLKSTSNYTSTSLLNKLSLKID